MSVNAITFTTMQISQKRYITFFYLLVLIFILESICHLSLRPFSGLVCVSQKTWELFLGLKTFRALSGWFSQVPEIFTKHQVFSRDFQGSFWEFMTWRKVCQFQFFSLWFLHYFCHDIGCLEMMMMNMIGSFQSCTGNWGESQILSKYQ